MNAERLHAISLRVRKAIESVELVQRLEQVVSVLQSVARNPQDSNAQQALARNLERLDQALSAFPTDQFSPAWRQALEELGGSEVLGRRLGERVHGIIQRDKIVPAAAHKEIQEIFEALRQFKTAIDAVADAFTKLKIGAEELKPGECELGVLIPREAIHSRMREFADELKELDFVFGTFSELASGDRETLKVGTISSSDLMVFLGALPAVAACIAVAAERISQVYKSLLEIRKLKGELKAQGLKEKELKGISDHANSLMNKEIEKLTLEIVEEYYHGDDASRRNELTNGVRISLSKMANRNDQGFSIEVRVAPGEEREEGRKPTGDEKARREHLARARQAAEVLQFIKTGGARILSLPEAPTSARKTRKRE